MVSHTHIVLMILDTLATILLDSEVAISAVVQITLIERNVLSKDSHKLVIIFGRSYGFTNRTRKRIQQTIGSRIGIVTLLSIAIK
jgi:hypothetical protein